MNKHNNDNDLEQLKSNLFNLACGFVFLAIFFSGYLWWLNITPILSLETSLNSETFYELKSEGFEFSLQFLQFLATGFGGVAILFNVYYAAKRATALEKTAQATEKNIEVAQNSQITERFTKAVEQLGSENLSICLGGIYALEKIAQDAPKTYHWTIMEILCAFIRNHELSGEKNVSKGEASIIKKNRDLETALKVIGRRNTQYDSENSLLDLRGSNLSFTQLDNDNYNFSKAIFVEAFFKGITWDNVILESARFNFSDLTKARFLKCCFKEARLEDTILSNTRFLKCDLQQTSFRGAKEFDSQDFSFSKSELEGADFTFCNSLTQEQIKAANGDETTILPDNLTIPESWKNKKNNNQ